MVEELIAELKALEAEGAAAVAAAADAGELERLRVEYAGRKGRLTGVLRRLGEMSPDERPLVGAEANRVKEALGALLDERAAALAAPKRSGPRVDLSLP